MRRDYWRKLALEIIRRTLRRYPLAHGEWLWRELHDDYPKRSQPPQVCRA